MPAHTQITVSQLSRLIGTPQMPVIVDVCIDDDFHADPRLIPSSFRLPYKDIASLAPQAAGLLAASLGLSQMYRDDLQQLSASMSLYDAFYHWARDVTGDRHKPTIAPAQDKAE